MKDEKRIQNFDRRPERKESLERPRRRWTRTSRPIFEDESF
jgi:hypothetical protein